MSLTNHRAILDKGARVWNRWRRENPREKPRLMGADLSERTLRHIDLSSAECQGVNFYHTDLIGACFENARLMEVDLTNAKLHNAKMNKVRINDARAWRCKFIGAHLRGARFWGSDFREASFRGADLTGARLQHSNLNHADLTSATLDLSKIYGVSAWGARGVPRSQTDLYFGDPQKDDVSNLRTDNLQAAQLLNLLLQRETIGGLLDSVTSRCILLLGRFTGQRKRLKKFRSAVISLGYVPLVFDFREPTAHDLTETVLSLAGLSSLVIADVTNPRSVPLELQAIVPNYLTPVVPVLRGGKREFSMLRDLQGKFPWVLPTVDYIDDEDFIVKLQSEIVPAATRLRTRLLRRRSKMNS